MKPTTPNNRPRYDLGLNPPYQINYRAKRAGRHITATKRRITFQFGFSNADAINSGLTEADCRGEEHEVVLIWSHITGKRHLYMDGREIHTSKAARANTRFEYSWGLGASILKIIANGKPPMGEQNYRQFDLELDGMSYFDFSRIYELGGRTSRRSEGRAPLPAIGYSYHGAAYDARDDDEEEEDAVVVRPPPPVTEVNTTTSVDLFDTSAQPQIISPMPSLASSGSANTSSTSLTQYQYDEFMPVTNQKTFDSISNEILGAYDNSAANGNSVPQPAPSANAAPSTSRALVPVSEEGIDPISKSMKDLVNLDDITTAPFQPIGYTSSGAQQQNKPAVQSWDLVGRAPTLSEMRTVTSANGAATVQKEVMKQPPQQYYQGQQHQALVAYGAAPPPQQYGYFQGYSNVGYAPAY